MNERKRQEPHKKSARRQLLLGGLVQQRTASANGISAALLRELTLVQLAPLHEETVTTEPGRGRKRAEQQFGPRVLAWLTRMFDRPFLPNLLDLADAIRVVNGAAPFLEQGRVLQVRLRLEHTTTGWTQDLIPPNLGFPTVGQMVRDAIFSSQRGVKFGDAAQSKRLDENMEQANHEAELVKALYFGGIKVIVLVVAVDGSGRLLTH